jgi:hypothetical protein
VLGDFKVPSIQVFKVSKFQNSKITIFQGFKVLGFRLWGFKVSSFQGEVPRKQFCQVFGFQDC